MTLEAIYVVRHGFRTSWTLDPVTGIYSSAFPTPTGLPADPPLTSHGVDQSKELATHLLAIRPPIDIVYSSPYYRCLQTISPYVSLRAEKSAKDCAATAIRPEKGLCEFFGSAHFDQPIPAEPSVLKATFLFYDETYQTLVTPPRKGETIPELYDRVATTVEAIVKQCDAEGARSVILCTHAAVVIALGRVLTGRFPEHVSEPDFPAFTCGLSVYRRQRGTAGVGSAEPRLPTQDGRSLPDGHVRGGWTCEANSDCSFLSGGEERGWTFHGDEGFVGIDEPPQNSAAEKPASSKTRPHSRGEQDQCRL